MGKFKFGTKGIYQMVELEDSVNDIIAISPELYNGVVDPIVIEKEVIVEKLVPVEKIVNTHTVDYRTVEVPKEVFIDRIVTEEKIVEKIVQDQEILNKIEEMNKELNILKQKLSLTSENLSINTHRLENDIFDKMKSVKDYTKELKQDNMLEHLNFKKQFKNMKYYMMILLVLSIVGMVL